MDVLIRYESHNILRTYKFILNLLEIYKEFNNILRIRNESIMNLLIYLHINISNEVDQIIITY